MPPIPSACNVLANAPASVKNACKSSYLSLSAEIPQAELS